MRSTVNRFLKGSYAGLAVAVIGGFLLMPEVFGAPHRGISFWGNYFPAIIPYSAGLLISVVCFVWAALILPDYPTRIGMRRLILALSIGLAAILLTPEQTNSYFYWAHNIATVYLFLVAGIGAIWVMLHAGRTSLDWLLFWMLLAGSVLSLLSASYVRVLGVLAIGQILALNAGALIIIRAASRWGAKG